ncbi:MmcQ/YjbR family DNA-binding protein [Actinoplanes sp. NPDC023714]|uniref:MmcQ/YjbR family DNA-binding protein n=1 Tax=Actinoplanes sp. NPDC023714 TaxID=3154322 RepID=UPI0034054D22
MASVDDVRASALALPEVVEKPHFGMPAFRVADKVFASVTKDQQRLFLHLGAAEVEAELVHGDCQRLTRGATLIGLDADLVVLDADRLQRLLLAAWRHRAPRKVARSGPS